MKKLIFLLLIFLINYYSCYHLVEDPFYVQPLYKLPDKTEYKECYEPDELHKTNIIHIRPCQAKCEVGLIDYQSNKYAAGSRLFILININQPVTVLLLPPIVMSTDSTIYMCSKVRIKGLVYDAQMKELIKNENESFVEKEFSVNSIPIRILEFSQTPIAFLGLVSLLFPVKEQGLEILQKGCQLQIPLQVQVKGIKYNILIPITYGPKENNLKTSK